MDFVRNAFQTVTTCCLNCRDEDTTIGEPTERTPLFVEQRRNINNQQIFRDTEIEDNDFASSVPKRDEQTALNRIVQETNANIIDVAALDTHLLDQSEYNERVKMYSQKLALQWNHVQTNDIRGTYHGMLKDIPHPENHLSTNPNPDDISMIKNFAKEAANALNEIKVENNDELVVPFVIT